MALRRRLIRYKGSALIEQPSTFSPQEIRTKIQDVLRKHGFEPIGIRDIPELFLRQGQMVGNELFICEFNPPENPRDVFANFPQLTVLGIPRISVYRVQDQTRMATLMPSRLFNVLPETLVADSIRRRHRGVLRRYEALVLKVLKDLSGR